MLAAGFKPVITAVERPLSLGGTRIGQVVI